MATFDYQAVTPAGRLMKGTLEAPSAEAAKSMLAEMRFTVHELEKSPPARPAGRIGRNEFLMFNQQLASIAKAGIPLERGLRQLAGDIESASMRRIVLDLAADLEAGTPIEEAFEKRRAMFPPLYGLIVRAGIRSGRLSEMLTSLNRHFEMGNQTRRIFFEATAYPLVVLAIAAVMMTGIALLILPPFRVIFADMGFKLPLMTRMVLDMGDNIVSFWIIVAVVVAAVLLISAALSGFAGGRRFKETIRLRLPVLGRVYHRSLLSRLTDAMALLVGAGCDLPECLRLGAGATGSEVVKREAEFVAAGAEKGMPIVEAGQLATVIPPLLWYSVQVGYQRNELQDNLYGLSEMYAQQARTNQTRLQAMLLPLMLLIVGGFVAASVLALFMPLVGMVQGMSQ